MCALSGSPSSEADLELNTLAAQFFDFQTRIDKFSTETSGTIHQFITILCELLVRARNVHDWPSLIAEDKSRRI